jgi:hypothetical protein
MDGSYSPRHGTTCGYWDNIYYVWSINIISEMDDWISIVGMLDLVDDSP